VISDIAPDERIYSGTWSILPQQARSSGQPSNVTRSSHCITHRGLGCGSRHLYGGSKTGAGDLRSRQMALRRIVAVIASAAFLLPGCGTSPPKRTPIRGNFAGLVAIGGGRKMYLQCRGTGSPTVVLVSGLDSAADVWTGYQADPSLAVLAQVARFTRACAYDRPGTTVGEKLAPSPSTAVPQRDHRPIRGAGQEVPGHRADQYGRQRRRGSCRRTAALHPAGRGGIAGHPDPPGNLGPVIAAAVAQHKLPAVVPRNFGYIDDRAWDKAQDALARLVPGARHVVVTSGHNIQIEHPRAVIGPIHDVVVTARRQQGHGRRLQSQCRRSGAPR
jgi:hypothetical protein